MAYFNLSIVQGWSTPNEASRNSLKKAVELADKTTERERLQIFALNYEQQNNLPMAVEVYEQLLDRYPHEVNNYRVLGNVIYARQLMEPEKAVEVLHRGLRIEPSAKYLWNVLAYSLVWLNRKQEALDAIGKYITWRLPNRTRTIHKETFMRILWSMNQVVHHIKKQSIFAEILRQRPNLVSIIY